MADIKEKSSQDLAYSIVITNILPEKIDTLSKEFAAIFSLDLPTAEQILKGSPIIFAEKLPRSEIKTLKPKLLELSKNGVEFTITTEVLSSMPKVIWTTPFSYAEGKIDNSLKSIDFQWKENAFICPSCGETYLFQRIGNPFKGKNASCTAVKAETTEKPSQPKIQPTISVKNDAEAEEIIELAPLEEEVLEPTPEVLEPEPESNEEVIEAVEEIIDAPEIIEDAKNEEMVMEPTVDIALQDIRAYPSSKRDIAAKIISEISNKPIDETRKLLSRSSSPIFSDVPGSQASDGMEQLKKIGISGKILKKKA